jgi:uncharacterized membrane protein
MNKFRVALNDYQAQIVTAVIGAIVSVLVVAVPALAQYQDVLLEIILLVVGLIVGVSLQKSNR